MKVERLGQAAPDFNTHFENSINSVAQFLLLFRTPKQPLSINLDAKLPMLPADITVRTTEKRTSIKWATIFKQPLVRFPGAAASL